MTNETRALIEAAEAVLDHCMVLSGEDVEWLDKLRAAISSAKAAEEGVDTALDLLKMTDRTFWRLSSGMYEAEKMEWEQIQEFLRAHGRVAVPFREPLSR